MIQILSRHWIQRGLKKSLPTCGTASRVTSFSSQQSNNDPPSNAATVIQGPSLLVNTGISRPSPSLFFLPGLRSLPFWTAPHDQTSKLSIAYADPTITKVVKHLEDNFETIKDEYMSAVMGVSNERDVSDPNSPVSKPLEADYDVNLKGGEHASEKLHKGSWDWHSYILNGTIQPQFEEHCPKTVAIVQELQEFLFSDNPFGFSFFSTLHEKSYIQPHYGPMNLRLRLHLPLIVPKHTKPDAFSNKPVTKCGIRVGDQIRSWVEGKTIVLDDSYEHEVWNETGELRVLFLLDVWHPDIRMEERQRISEMFQFASEQGWMGNNKK